MSGAAVTAAPMGFLDKWFGKKQAAEQPVSPQEYFTREVEQLLMARPNVTVRRGAEEFTLIINANGRDSTAFLGNVFHHARELEPERRRELLDRFVSGLTDPEPEFATIDEAREVLAVTLRGPVGGEHGKNMVAREFLPCLQEYLVIDGAHRISFCMEPAVSKWNTPLDELFAIGRQRIADTGARLSFEEDRGVYSVDNDDDYESARLLLPGFLASFADQVKGRPIAVVPTRNQLYIAGDADPATVISFCELAEREYAASPRRVSAAIYSVDEAGRVVRYVRDVKDEAALRARASHVRFEGNEYTAQRQDLQAQQEIDLNPAFIASFGGLESKAGELLSWASIASELQTWLPRTDLLVIQHGSEQKLFAWDEVQRVAPHRLKPVPDLFPPRWETLGDFTAEELAQMTPTDLG